MSDETTERKLTRTELMQRLQEILDRDGSIEEGHIEADDALLDYIDDAEIADLYDRISKWYA